MKNIDKRFKSSLPVLSAYSAFDPMLTPNRQTPAFHAMEMQEFKTEWKKMKYNLLSWKEHIPRDTLDGKKGHTY